ncbi:MAG: right-handed parallel beta-helix repeat-containing protein [Planctomycetota bacterium]
MRSAILALLFFASFVIRIAAQTTHLVPSPADSIQNAINLASDGDTVSVGAGVWHERINFLGKAIRVVGLGPGVSTIDAQFTGSVVTFSNQEQSNSILEGFTITGGHGDPFFFGTTLQSSGGGIAVIGAYVPNGPAVCSPTIVNCEITGCFAERGAGVWVFGYSHVDLVDCRILSSTRIDPTGVVVSPVGVGGDGVYAQLNCRVTMTGGEISASEGAAFFVETASLGSTVSGVTFDSNLGSAVLFNGGQSHRVSRCRFISNSSPTSGGAMACGNNNVPGSFPPILVEDCIFVGNSAPFEGGALYVGGSSEVLVSSCTFLSNSASLHGVASTIGFAALEFRNTIVRACGPNPVAVTPNPLGVLTLASCNIESGPVAPGVVDVDPLFVDASSGDFRLEAASPMIDAGSNALMTTSALDFAGRPRILNGTIDIGAHESDDIANHATAAGNLVDPGAGTTFRAIRVNGDDGGSDHRVAVPAFSPWSLSFTSPTWMTPHPDFAIFGALAEATIETVVNVPLGVGEMSFVPCPVVPQFEGPVFTLTSTVPLPCNAVLPSVPGPTWTTPLIPGLPGPIDVSFQGVVLDAVGGLHTTNLLIVNIR